MHLLQLHGEDLCEEGNFQLFDLLTLCLQRNENEGLLKGVEKSIEDDG